MSMLGRTAFVIGYAASLGLFTACEGRPSMEVRASAVPVGDKVNVSFDREITGRAVDQYWLVLAPEGAPDAYAEERIFVERNARSSAVDAMRPGRYELRLHGDFPHRQHNVIARAKVEITPRSLADGRR
jgi:hypothetical protein